MKSLVAVVAGAVAVLAHDNDTSSTHPHPSTGITSATVPTTSVPPPSQTGCPTVTVTGELCQTCPVPMCLRLSTVTQSCGCPTPIPTVTVDFPCANKCKGIECPASYDYVTLTDCGTKPTHSPTSPTGTSDTTHSSKPPKPPCTAKCSPSDTPTTTPPPGTATPPPAPTTRTTSTFVTVNAANLLRPFWAVW